MLRRLCRWGMLLLIGVLPLFAVVAQATTTYTITSNRTVNARSCPRLNCGVVTTFDSGEEIEVVDVVSGDTVSGSTEWVQIEVEGREAYIHGSLVTEAEANDDSRSGLSRGGSGDTNPDGSLDTSDWDINETRRFSIATPPSWSDVSDLLDNPAFLDDLRDLYGDNSDALDNIEMALEQGLLDLLMVDIRTGATMALLHQDLEGVTLTPRLLRTALAVTLEDGGAEIIEESVVELPVGDAVRFWVAMDADFGLVPVDSDALIYAILTRERMYLMVFSVTNGDFEDFIPTFDAIAATFIVNDSNT